MTDEQRNIIEKCRIVIIGNSDFAEIIGRELLETGFVRIAYSDSTTEDADMGIDLVVDGHPALITRQIPVVYPFDFIEGGAAMVLLPGVKLDVDNKDNFRLWAAKYISGYCTFWNVENSDWLFVVLPRIANGEQSLAAKNSAARICARILANLAVGRNVKYFPRFYLIYNSET